MDVIIPLDKMTVAEKLRVMEEIWDDLQRTPDQVPSPAWHEDVLRAREGRIREAQAHYSDWSEVKARIRQQTK